MLLLQVDHEVGEKHLLQFSPPLGGILCPLKLSLTRGTKHKSHSRRIMLSPLSTSPLASFSLFFSDPGSPKCCSLHVQGICSCRCVSQSFDPTFLHAGSMILLEFSRVLVWESEKLKSLYDFLLFDSRVRVGE